MLGLIAKKRGLFGKKVKTLRQKGLFPAIMYGRGVKNIPLELKFSDFAKIWEKAGESTLVELDIDGEIKNVLISDVQFDPLTDEPRHADFHAVRMDEKIRAKVPIEFTGESPAVKNFGAVLVKVMYEAEVEALPADLPQDITVDISGLSNFEDRIFIKDISLGSSVDIIAGPDDVVILVSEPKKEEALVAEVGLESIEVIEKGKKEKETEAAVPEEDAKQ